MSAALAAMAVLGVVAAHAVMNGARLGEQSFWTDELFSVSQANLDLIAMLSSRRPITTRRSTRQSCGSGSG